MKAKELLTILDTFTNTGKVCRKDYSSLKVMVYNEDNLKGADLILDFGVNKLEVANYKLCKRSNYYQLIDTNCYHLTSIQAKMVKDWLDYNYFQTK